MIALTKTLDKIEAISEVYADKVKELRAKVTLKELGQYEGDLYTEVYDLWLLAKQK